MAPLVLELAGETAVFEVEVVPGVTAALAAAARLGAPLGHDHAVLSLSDLMTPWQLIRERVIAARDADLVLCLYNPRSARRSWQLTAVRELLLERRRPETPVGIVTNASRLDESVELTILSLLDVEKVGMTTCVIVGSSRTRIVGGRMVTPRGYELADEGR
jgi:cobalt-precorrin 5A hydrolase/precorrin-3B C17-methyltransferase